MDKTIIGTTIFDFLTSTAASSTAPYIGAGNSGAITQYLSQPLSVIQAATPYSVSTDLQSAAVTKWLDVPVAPWLAAVERRLNASIGITGGSDQQNGTSLRKEVVRTANSFFAATSAVLPSEPYLYGLPGGELVAEFEGAIGRMTVVISNDTALALSMVNGHTMHKEIAINGATPDTLQMDLSAIISQLSTDKHGTMDTER